MAAPSVLRVNATEERADYREAVAEILRRIQAECSVTLLEIAEEIDVSLGTISNAANKKADLCAPYLSRLGKRFGPHFMDPYLKLLGGRAVPLEVQTVRDVLPFISRAALKISVARSADSPNGPVETHREKGDYLPDLRAMIKEAQALVCQIETELAA